MNTNFNSSKIISKIIFGSWIGIIFITLCTMKGNLLKIFTANQRYIRLIELFIVLAIVCEWIFLKTFYHKWSDAKKGGLIFIIALGVRLVCLFLSEEYVPTSDFNNYFLGACHFAKNGFAGGSYDALEAYGLPSFAGQAIINGIFMNILSPTLLGMQILNALYTSGICLMLFIIGKEVNAKASLLGAVFYTFYPCSILSTQVTTNHHGAAFFILLSIYCYFNGLKHKNVKARFAFIILSAICLVFSNFYHPSVVIVLCAFSVYALVHELEKLISMPSTYIKELKKEIKRFTGTFILTITLVVLYVCIYGSSIAIIKGTGYYKSEKSFPLLGKFVVGFNFEYGGAYNPVDGKYILSFPEEEWSKVSFELIKERIKEHGWPATFMLLLEKNQRAWFGEDNYFSFYQSGIRQNLTEKIEGTTDAILKSDYEKQFDSVRYTVADVAAADSFFVIVICFLASIGILRILLKYKDNNLMYMLMYIPLGWMAFIMISEMQPRYRYQGMTVLVLVAGFGAETVVNGIRKIYWQIHEHINTQTLGRKNI